MNMICNSIDAITLASSVACDHGQIGVEIRPHSIIKKRPSPLRTENHVYHTTYASDNGIAKSIGRAFSPPL
jgi:hypothetical protein